MMKKVKEGYRLEKPDHCRREVSNGSRRGLATEDDYVSLDSRVSNSICLSVHSKDYKAFHKHILLLCFCKVVPFLNSESAQNKLILLIGHVIIVYTRWRRTYELFKLYSSTFLTII